MAIITGTNLAEILTSGAASDRINALGGNDTLVGNGGNDTLDGGTGTDSMKGGAGNDFYFVNVALDKVVELGAQGTDTVSSSVTYTLPVNVEKLILTGAANINGTGNTLNNTLTGNLGANRLNGLGGADTIIGGGGADTLDGGVGNDSMVGGAGNDLYFVGAALDKVVEAGGGGTDTVNSTVTHTLALNVEKLIQGGAANIAGTGNTLNNTLTGNGGNNNLKGLGGADTVNGGAGADTLDGGTGADSLVGGAGNDTLIWDTTDVKVNGGADTDTLRVTGVTALNLTAVSDTKIVDVEVINLAGTNALTLNAADVLAISSTTDTLRVDGGAGDAVIAGAGWTQIANTTINLQTYAQYTQDGATLQVDLDIDRSGIAVAEMNLSLLDGTNGFQLAGEANNNFAGFSVASAGDVNGDGIDDLLVGAYGHDAFVGAAYVVFGAASGLASNLALSALDGTSGFRITGEASDDLAGRSVASAGDVNGDGYDDLVVGADHYGATNNGAAYVVFGAASGFASNLALSGLDGTSGFRITGEADTDFAGFSVASAGDVNGDGYDDLLVGAYRYGTSNGAAYVVFGAASGFASSLALSGLDGTSGFRIAGEADFDYAGQSVSSAGDVNGDGYDDLLVGAPRYGAYVGAAYVVFGKASGFTSNLALSALDGTIGFQITGEANGNFAGRSVASAGDVNGDGYDDLLVGAPSYGTSNGAAYVVFGAASGFASNLALSGLDGVNGFQITGETNSNYAGASVASAGDVNGDGYDDLLVGAYGYGAFAGAAYVVFGKASGFASNLTLAALDGTNGFQVSGETANDWAGRAVSSAGDVNGDGFADLLVGAFQADPNGNSSGASYVVYGRDWNGVVDFLGTADANTLTGTGAAEVFVAGRGNDTMNGGGGADVFRGGAGDDRIVLTDTGFFDADGGTGTDTLALTGSGLTLDLTAIADSEITDIEVIDLTGSGNNTLTLDALEVLNLSGASNTLRVDGNSGDAVIAGSGWTQIANTTIGGQAYAQYTQGAATLQVDVDVDRGGIAVEEMSVTVLDGTNGFQLSGEVGGDRSGYSVAAAGDVNGDGYDDLLVGAFTYGASDNGAAYVVFGAASGFASNLALSGLDGTSGFQLAGEANLDYAGISVASAGDVNGDGYDDLLVGANGYGAYVGAAYVVFGAASGFASNLALSGLDGTNGFQLTGEANGDQAGVSIASAGDVNGDGYDDLLVGANSYGAFFEGAAYVVFGKASGFASNLALSALDGASGFQLTSEANYDSAGISVASAGDVNGDGYDDLLVGASGYGGSNNGAAYVVFGAAGGFASNLALSALDGTSGFQLTGEADYDTAGRSVASAGDVNGDGYGDLLVGALNYGASDNGAAYVVFGKASGFASNLALSALDGTSGFQISGEADYDYAGRSVASAGDVNGDGYDDLLVGAWGYGDNIGAAYVVFGAASGFASNLALSALDGTNGFQLTGEATNDNAGFSVSSAGDVNGDGFADLVIGAPYADPYGLSSGASYVVYGRDFNDVVDFLGTVGADMLTGTGAAEAFVAGRGNDTLTGGGGADVFRGGEGDDHIEIADAAFADVDGGSGTDTLTFSGSGVSLDLTAAAEARVSGIEVIDLAGSGNNTLTIDVAGLVAQTEGVHELRVKGNAGDAVVASDGLWINAGQVTIESVGYTKYTQGPATLFVQNGIDTGGIASPPVNIDLTALDGTNGFQISGESSYDYSGVSVSSAGDVNGDGFDDLIVGTRIAGPYSNRLGASYVVFGQASGFASELNLSALNGANGFQLSGGAVHDYSGRSVSSAGDVNGDGFGDLIVGAHHAYSYYDHAGASYVVFGQASGFASNLNLAALNGANGFRIQGEAEFDYSGVSVSSAGDVNGDGLDDLIVGANGADPHGTSSGASYVVFGQASGFAPDVNLLALDVANGFQLSGEASGHQSGISVSSAGDVNGDGFDDLIIGAYGAGPHGGGSGASYVVFGQASGFGSNLDLSALDGTNGFQISGEAAGDYSGFSVSSAGDVNRDGFDDLIVGASGADLNGANSGVSYVVFGQASGFGSNFDLSALDGANGFQITGEAASDLSGRSVSSAGDVNGDGFDDLIVGAFRAGSYGNMPGSSYVVFGQASGFASNLDLSALDGMNGFQISGESSYDYSGGSVSSAGDVNGDGFDDLIVGAYHVSRLNAPYSGASYVVFGRDFRDDVDFLGTAGADTLNAGTGAAEVFVAGQGNDTLTGGGGADVFRGGAGDDRIVIGDATFADVDGGSGTDTLALTGDSVTLDLTLIANSKVTGIEIVDLDDGSGGNTLTLALGDVLDLSDTSNTLTVEGDGDDTVTVADGSWTDGGEVAGYHFYTLGAATLRIDADITSVTITLV